MALFFKSVLTTLLICTTFSAYSKQPPRENALPLNPESTQNKTIQWTPENTDIRILEIRVAHFVLEEIITGYQYKDIILLPLGALSESIDIAISSSPQNNAAKGFIFNKKNTFYLDTDQNEVTLNGKIQKYTPDLVHVLLDDIYVESNLLSQWLNLTLDVNLFLSQLLIVSDDPLPFQKRLEREKKIARSLSRIKTKSVYFPRHYEPYQHFSIPFIDQTITAKAEKRANGKNNITYNYSTFVTADLAKLESRWYLNGNENETINDFRVTFGRKDSEAKLLGPLNATNFSFGHIYTPQVNLITQASSIETGFTVSNFNIDRQIEYDKHTFVGDLQPGWEVELYRNNALIGYRSESTNGQYRFEDSPLLYGNNHFRLVFYGPQGQIREEESLFQLGDSLTQAGKHFYRASISKDDNDNNKFIAQYDFGLKKNLSASINFSSIPLDSNKIQQHQFLNLGLQSFYDNFFFNLEFAQDIEEGNAIELRIQSNFDNFIVGFDHAMLNNFQSEQFFNTTNPLKSKTNARINTSINTSFLPRIPISFEISNETFSNDSSTNKLLNQISFNAYNVAYNNQLTIQKINNTPKTTFGSFQLSYTDAAYSIRGDINYTVSPLSEISTTSINYDLRDFYTHLLKVSLSHSPLSNITSLKATLNKPKEKYNLSYGASINSNNDFSVEMNFSIGIGQSPRKNNWIYKSRSLATSGSISAKVFIDSNQNGIHDTEEQPLENVGFIVNGSNKKTQTNKEGIAFLSSLPPHRGVDVSISNGTLEDPLWSPAITGVHTFPRPGTTIQLDFPIFQSGEIDGTVFVTNNSQTIGASNMIIELIDDSDRVIKSVNTEYDGFYIMSKIPIGKYRLRISPAQLNKLNLYTLKDELVEITADNSFQNGFDFILHSNKSE